MTRRRRRDSSAYYVRMDQMLSTTPLGVSSS
jgi:hypothetical protein